MEIFRWLQMSFSIWREVNICEHTWCHLCSVFTYIYSLLIKKDICDCWNVSIISFHLCLSPGDLFIFFGKSFLFLFLFFVKYEFAEQRKLVKWQTSVPANVANICHLGFVFSVIFYQTFIFFCIYTKCSCWTWQKSDCHLMTM